MLKVNPHLKQLHLSWNHLSGGISDLVEGVAGSSLVQVALRHNRFISWFYIVPLFVFILVILIFKYVLMIDL